LLFFFAVLLPFVVNRDYHKNCPRQSPATHSFLRTINFLITKRLKQSTAHTDVFVSFLAKRYRMNVIVFSNKDNYKDHQSLSYCQSTTPQTRRYTTLWNIHVR